MVGVNFIHVVQQPKSKVINTAEDKRESLDIYHHNIILKSLYFKTFIFIAVLAILFILTPSIINYVAGSKYKEVLSDDNKCRISLVESIPEGLIFNGSNINHLLTYDAWMNMLKQAKYSVVIVSFYWILKGGKDKEGEDVLNELFEVLKRGVKLKIIQNIPTNSFPNNDTELLRRAGAEVLNLDMKKFYDSGVLHTKFWVVDDEILYLGSANTDWRSLTQVKELGVLITSCKCLVRDSLKIVGVFEYAAINDKLPLAWPSVFRTQFNKDKPLLIKLNGTDSEVYLTSSPLELCPSGRTFDLDAILDVIQKANKFVNIAVMDYSPFILFVKTKSYWPVIDDALRKAALERKVKINFLGSIWSNTKADMIPFLKSLAILNDISSTVSIKLFCIPSNDEQKLMKYGRVNHNKYMVTDNAAFISTSNWVGDYFVNTAGVSIVLNQTLNHSEDQNFHSELLQTFLRDWTYKHSVSIWDVQSINYTCDYF